MKKEFEVKLKIIVPNDYTGNNIKLSLGNPIEIIKKSELDNNLSIDKEFELIMNEVIRKHFGYFGEKIDKACDDIIKTALGYKK